jgi:hypothetical protein
MVVVVFRLEGLGRGRDKVTEYLVLEASSRRAVTVSRRLLLQLVRACGLQPEPGSRIQTSALVGAYLTVRVEHDIWNGSPRLRVVQHRPPAPPESRGPASEADAVGEPEFSDEDSVPF